MVFQDYEIIATKRVGHSRKFQNIYRRHVFNAMGGVSTVYFTTFCYLAGTTFGLTSSTAVIRPLMSSPGMRSLFSNAATRGGACMFGLVVGI